jgi:hypothetical protein
MTELEPEPPAVTSPTGWLCSQCRAPVSESATVCPKCRLVLTRKRRIQVSLSRPAAPDGSSTRTVMDVPARAPDRRTRDCPYCKRPLHDVDALMCVPCNREVPPAEGDSTETIRLAVRIDLELRFQSGGVVRVPAGTEAVIGRHGTHGSRRVLSGQQQIGRQHAFLRVDAQGRVQVRDNDSLNGTFINGERIANDWRDLPIGSQLRLGLSVSASAGRPA